MALRASSRQGAQHFPAQLIGPNESLPTANFRESSKVQTRPIPGRSYQNISGQNVSSREHSKCKVLDEFLACLRNSKERVRSRVRLVGVQSRSHSQKA